MQVQYIPARISEARATRFFNRRRPGNLFGCLRRRSSMVRQENSTQKILPYLELVWMPYYLIDLQVSSHKGKGEIAVSVEACSGAFALFQMHADLVADTPKEEMLPILLPEDEVVPYARKQLLQTIMRRRGQRGKPVIEEHLNTAIFYYPFWVCYSRSRSGALDIQLQDALTGERGGNRNRAGVLNAFTYLSHQKKAGS